MKILFWGRFTTHHFAIRNVILNIANRLGCDKNNKYTLLTNNKNVSCFSSSTNVEIKNVCIDPDDAMRNHMFTLFVLPFYVLFNKYDMVIFPQITFYFFKTSKILFYIHDLIEFKVDNQKKIALKLRRLFYRWIVKIANHIITVSCNSKNDVVSILKYPDEKISVVYNGRDENLKKVHADKALLEIYKSFPLLNGISKYFLYVGYLTHPQKNLLFVLDEIEKFLKEDYFFILIGPNGKDANLIHDRIYFLNKSLGKNKIIYIGTVDKKYLPYFYSGASCFIFPSIYEGFGMPVIEAMSCGCPVVTSNTSSLKEIAEGYAMLINPYVPDELRNALGLIISNQKKDMSFYEEHLKKFTWENHVHDLVNIINHI